MQTTIIDTTEVGDAARELVRDVGPGWALGDSAEVSQWLLATFRNRDVAPEVRALAYVVEAMLNRMEAATPGLGSGHRKMLQRDPQSGMITGIVKETFGKL